MMGVRKVLDLVFDNNELKILDDILPEFKRHEKLNLEEEDKVSGFVKWAIKAHPARSSPAAYRRPMMRTRLTRRTWPREGRA